MTTTLKPTVTARPATSAGVDSPNTDIESDSFQPCNMQGSKLRDGDLVIHGADQYIVAGGVFRTSRTRGAIPVIVAGNNYHVIARDQSIPKGKQPVAPKIKELSGGKVSVANASQVRSATSPSDREMPAQGSSLPS